MVAYYNLFESVLGNIEVILSDNYTSSYESPYESICKDFDVLEPIGHMRFELDPNNLTPKKSIQEKILLLRGEL